MCLDAIVGALLASWGFYYSWLLWRRDRRFDRHADQAIALATGEDA